MKLEFASESFKNFKCFKKGGLYLGPHKGRAGLCLIRSINEDEPDLAENGCGKSTLICDIPTWICYGQTLSGLRTPDIVPWQWGGSPFGALHLKSDGKEHLISRSYKPGLLTLDEKEVGQDRILEVLGGMTLLIVANTIMLGQGKPFFFDREPREKMQLFIDTLDLERWERRSKAAGDETNECEKMVSELQAKQEGFELALDNAKKLLADVERQAREWRDELQVDVKQIEKEAAALQKELELKQKKLDGAILAFEGAETEARACQRECEKMTAELRTAEGRRSNRLAHIKACERERDLLEQDLKMLDDARSCPTCGQPIEKRTLFKHRLEIRERLEPINKDIAEGVPKRLLTIIDTLEQRIKDSFNYARAFTSKADSARSTIDLLAPEVASINTRIREIQKTAASKKDTANPYRDQLTQLNKQKQQMERELDDVIEEKQKAARQAERRRFWIKGFKDIRLNELEEILQELEIETCSMLDGYGLVGWELKYGIEREGKSGATRRGLFVQVQSPRSKGFVRWENWSGGEGQRLRIIGNLALAGVLLNRYGVEPSMEVLDEPTSFIGDTGVADMVEMLATRARELNRQIFLIDHQVTESSQFSDIITVVKDKSGVSRIET